MKHLIIVAALLVGMKAGAQELYIFSEPASNMSAKSLGLRMNNYFQKIPQEGRLAYRLDPELMWGANKNLMLHANLYASNMMQTGFRFEGGSVYAKYRFLSVDDIHKHFRMAAFGKLSLVDNPYQMEHTETHQLPDGTQHQVLVQHSSNEQSIDGTHSGAQLGLVATQLIHKLALSATASHMIRMNNLGGNDKLPGSANGAFQYTASAGYLLFPRNYENYNQTNINLYAELQGQRVYGQPGYYVDAAPGLQFIFNSIARLDLGYRFQLKSNMYRYATNQLLVRFEYNWLNLFGKKGS